MLTYRVLDAPVAVAKHMPVFLDLYTNKFGDIVSRLCLQHHPERKPPLFVRPRFPSAPVLPEIVDQASLGQAYVKWATAAEQEIAGLYGLEVEPDQ